jgi:uncharacterized lipoprotein
MIKIIKINFNNLNAVAIFNNRLAILLMIAISFCFCCSCSYYKQVFVNKDQDYTNAKTNKPLKVTDPTLLIEKNNSYSIPDIKSNSKESAVDILPPDYNN